MNRNLYLAARNAVILSWGAASFAGAQYAEENIHKAMRGTVKEREVEARACLRHLGATATESPMPVACRRVLESSAEVLRDNGVTEPIYRLPSREEVADLAGQQDEAVETMIRSTDGFYFWSIGSLAFMGGIGIGALTTRRLNKSKTFRRVPGSER